MTDTVKYEDTIDKVARAEGCTQSGIIWLKNALDPFPDAERDATGYPDTVKTPSLVQPFREEIQVVESAGLAGVAWDCLIWHPGWMNSFNFSSKVADSNFMLLPSTGQGSAIATGPIEVRQAASGSPMPLNTVTQAMVPQASMVLKNRVVAMGFEVINVTEDVNKCGAITAFRQPAIALEDTRMLCTTFGTNSTPVKNVQFQDAPQSAAQALILAGSREWKAADGAYVVAVADDPVNKLKSVNDTQNAMLYSNSTLYTSFLSPGANSVVPQVSVVKSGFDQCGVYLTGLNAATKLKVVLHYIIERFPTLANTDLITMAKASPPYDPAALALYTKLSNKLPMGCPVDKNSLGDWIGTIASIAKAVPKVVSVVNAVLNPKEKQKLEKEVSKNVRQDMQPLIESVKVLSQASPFHALVDSLPPIYPPKQKAQTLQRYPGERMVVPDDPRMKMARMQGGRLSGAAPRKITPRAGRKKPEIERYTSSRPVRKELYLNGPKTMIVRAGNTPMPIGY